MRRSLSKKELQGEIVRLREGITDIQNAANIEAEKYDDVRCPVRRAVEYSVQHVLQGHSGTPGDCKTCQERDD